MRRDAHISTYERAFALRAAIIGIEIGIAAPRRGAASSGLSVLVLGRARSAAVRSAPSATRTPISQVRRATTWESTPYNPASASTNAKPPSTPERLGARLIVGRLQGATDLGKHAEQMEVFPADSFTKSRFGLAIGHNGLPELPPGMAHVAPERFRKRDRVHAIDLLADECHVAELCQRNGFSQRRLWNRAKSPSVEQRMRPCSRARAARCASGTRFDRPPIAASSGSRIC